MADDTSIPVKPTSVKTLEELYIAEMERAPEVWDGHKWVDGNAFRKLWNGVLVRV